MSFLRTTFRVLLHPTWRGTLGKKTEAPWAASAEQWSSINNHAVRKIDAVKWAEYILSNNINTRDQEKTINTLEKRAMRSHSIMISSLIFIAVSLVLYYFEYTDSLIYSVVGLALFQQSLMQWVLNLHRRKQITCGAIFPIIWMIKYPINIRNIDTGIYYRKTLAYPAMPFMGEALHLLKKYERVSLEEEQSPEIHRGNDV